MLAMSHKINSIPKPASVLIVALGLIVVALQPAFSSTSTASKASSSPKSTSTSAPATSGVSSGKSILRMGSKGESVKELQNALKSKGFFLGAADGSFGNQTQASVIKFQTSKKLVADGVVGSSTWAALR